MSSLVSDIFGLRPNEPISASMALETPQVVLRWRFSEGIPEIEEVKVRRSLFRFPESISEGDALLDEVQDPANLRTSFSDLSPAADQVNYYSTFFQHKGPFSLVMDSRYDSERMGTIRHVFLRTPPYVNYWLLARDEQGRPVIWSFNTLKDLIERRIDLSKIVNEQDEQVIAITTYATGLDDTFALVTSKRFIEFSIALDAVEVLPADIFNEFSFLSTLSSGFEVRSAADVSGDVAVLDIGNDEIVRLTTAGSVVSTQDLSNLSLLGDFNGLMSDGSYYFLGCGKIIYQIDVTDPAPLNNAVAGVYPVRQNLNSGFFIDFTGSILIFGDNSLQEIQRYLFTSSLSSYTQMEEETVPQSNVYGSWRLEETTGPVIDSSGYGYDGTVVGNPSRGVPGKFRNGVQFLDVGDALDLTPATNDFSLDDGYYSFWWKSPYAGFRAFTTDKTLFIATDGGPTFESKLEAKINGDIEVTITRSGTPHTITYVNGQADIDDGIFHHFLVIWSGGTLAEFYVDDVFIGSVVLTGVGGATTAMSLGLAGSSFLGFYDDLSFGAGVAFTRFTRYSLTTRGNRAHALGGRDYTENGQHWRDKLRFEFGEYLLRNDFDISTLPQDKELQDGEEIFRQAASELELGNLGKLSRLIGLLLDRVTDYRRFFMNHVNSLKAEYEFIDELGELINAIDINEEWNVEVRRRFLETMFFCYHRSGTLDAFSRLTRFLGFRLLKPDEVVGPLVQVYRGFFDSVVDPDRVDVPFDTITFDSGGDDTQFVDIVCKFFEQNRMADVGSTSIPATREFTDLTASFLTQAEPGSLIIINDQDTEGDNGQYLITSVLSNTVVVVDRDWPVGSLSPLQYRLHWRLPPPDPYNEMLLTRLNTIKVRWQNLVVNL